MTVNFSITFLLICHFVNPVLRHLELHFVVWNYQNPQIKALNTTFSNITVNCVIMQAPVLLNKLWVAPYFPKSCNRGYVLKRHSTKNAPNFLSVLQQTKHKVEAVAVKLFLYSVVCEQVVCKRNILTLLKEIRVGYWANIRNQKICSLTTPSD